MAKRVPDGHGRSFGSRPWQKDFGDLNPYCTGSVHQQASSCVVFHNVAACVVFPTTSIPHLWYLMNGVWEGSLKNGIYPLKR